jgi:hypothetical protein
MSSDTRQIESTASRVAAVSPSDPSHSGVPGQSTPDHRGNPTQIGSTAVNPAYPDPSGDPGQPAPYRRGDPRQSRSTAVISIPSHQVVVVILRLTRTSHGGRRLPPTAADPAFLSQGGDPIPASRIEPPLAVSCQGGWPSFPLASCAAAVCSVTPGLATAVCFSAPSLPAAVYSVTPGPTAAVDCVETRCATAVFPTTPILAIAVIHAPHGRADPRRFS